MCVPLSVLLYCYSSTLPGYAKYMRDVMIFYGNTQNIYHLYIDNQAAEHIATQPNMNDHSRSIDIRIHGIRQDYLDNAMRIGGVASEDNTSDILTKNLQPHLHQKKHCKQLHLTKQRKQKNGTRNVLTLTSRRQTPLRNCRRKTNKLRINATRRRCQQRSLASFQVHS